MLSLRSIILLAILVPTATVALQCILQTDPLRDVASKVASAVSGGDARKYKCPDADKYCIYFEGNMEVGGKNETFAVRSCESDIRHYLGPIGEKVGRTIGAKCEKVGPTRMKVGPLSYYFNCCMESDCNDVSGAGTTVVHALLVVFSAMMLAIPTYF